MVNEKISLKAARINAGMTLNDVSEVTGWNVNLLSRWENKKSIPNVVKAEKLCDIYMVSMNSISW